MDELPDVSANFLNFDIPLQGNVAIISYNSRSPFPPFTPKKLKWNQGLRSVSCFFYNHWLSILIWQVRQAWQVYINGVHGHYIVHNMLLVLIHDLQPYSLQSVKSRNESVMDQLLRNLFHDGKSRGWLWRFAECNIQICTASLTSIQFQHLLSIL